MHSLRNIFDSLRKTLEQPSVATLERIAGGLVVAACAFLLISASLASNAASPAEASGAVKQSAAVAAPGNGTPAAPPSTVPAPKATAEHQSAAPPAPLPQGVDYSFSHPDPHQLRAAGKSFVVRYLTGGTPKALSQPEAQAVRSAGLDVVSNYEDTTSDLTSGGFDHGVELAKKAEAAHQASGGPAKAPIYFSADSAPSGWGPAQWDSFRQNLQGIASVIGVDRVGLYGGTEALKTAQANHYASWFWQSLGWRDGQWLPFAHLQQHQIETSIGGGTVDLNRAQAGNYGQWGAAG
jgi:hypothetical protein